MFQAQTVPVNQGRIGGLDGLRGVAAVVVAFGFHMRFLFGEHMRSPLGSEWFPLWIHKYGWTLVDLFFVLSGFVFAQVYLKDRPLNAAADVEKFVVARFARLYPLHFLTLVATALLLADQPLNDVDDFFVHMFMLQGFLRAGGHSYVGPAWSVSIEIICYLVFVVGAYFARHHLFLFAMSACVAGLWLLVLDGPMDEPAPVSALGRGLFGFFVGQMLAFDRDLAERVLVRWWLIPLAVGLWLAGKTVQPVVAMNMLIAPSLIFLALRLRWLASPPMTWLGDRSYTIYLVHMLIIDLILQANGGPLPLTYTAFIWGHMAVILATLLVADLLYRFWEMPMRRAIMERYCWLRVKRTPLISV